MADETTGLDGITDVDDTDGEGITLSPEPSVNADAIKRAAEKAQRLQKEAKGVKDKNTPRLAGAKVDPKNLSTMLGLGSNGPIKVTIGTKEYTVYPFPLRGLGEAGKMFGSLNDYILSAGLTEPAEDGSLVDYEAVRLLMSEFYAAGSDEPVGDVSDEFMKTFMYSLFNNIDEAQTDVIENLALLALNREKEVITKDELGKLLDIPLAITLIRAIFNANMGLKGRFLAPSEANR